MFDHINCLKERKVWGKLTKTVKIFVPYFVSKLLSTNPENLVKFSCPIGLRQLSSVYNNCEKTGNSTVFTSGMKKNV